MGDVAGAWASHAVTEFLTAATADPTALLIEGEPGIGKTTAWLSAAKEACQHGFTVMSARPVASESVLAYASLADLLAGVSTHSTIALPALQRLAIDRILLREGADGEASNPRVAAAAFLSLVEQVAEVAPVLIAIDDLQWLDASSTAALAFAARRLSGPVKILGTIRTEVSDSSAAWLQLANPAAIRRLKIGPLSLGGLHAVLLEALGRSFARPTMARIHDISGGNPFYALELARAIAPGASLGDVALPATLAELVHVRIAHLDPAVKDALLAAACLLLPTVELVAAALSTTAEHVVELIEQVETEGLIGVEGHQLRFAHPLLAHGVYTGALPAQRRQMHRSLAGVVAEPELRARHLALAAVSADFETLQSLDAAAESARLRGAPAAAAELLDLAIELGGDTAERRLMAAQHHFGAGDPPRARSALERVVATLSRGTLRASALGLLAVVRLFDDSFAEAADLLERALSEIDESPALIVQTLITLTFALLNTGQFAAARTRAEDAVANAARLAQPELLSQALGMRVMVGFMAGDGLDAASLRRAVELEGHDAVLPMAFRPSAHHALTAAWTGELDEARTAIRSIRRTCIERGEEHELTFISFHNVIVEIWRGDFAAATLLAEDTMERASQIGGDLPLCVALILRATLGAHAGRVEQTRLDVAAAIAAGRRCGASTLTEWPVSALGFLELSLGDHRAALKTLQPQVGRLDATPDATEIIAASFVPDVVETMIQLRRFHEAEPLIERLERNGSRLDRPWMLAVGARGRAMLLLARGDLHEASAAVDRAMTEHGRLPMPFERARTQLLLGQLLRRNGHHRASVATLREAATTFAELNTPLWADRAHRELSANDIDVHPSAVLTPGERRVADLAATGLTNRKVAETLFISPKTVEANLVRIYQKLGIHSRAELGRAMSRSSDWSDR